ncbi:MAG: protein kinase [Polyangiales bacterium]
MRAPPSSLAAAVSQARYERGATIASGGMGSVVRAFDRLGQREVAYKRLTIADEQARRRAAALFQTEYETLKRLAHPNIVEVYEFGYDEAGPYYTMELLSGTDLLRLAPLPVAEACRVLRDVASALALVHARQKVHRDVSPNNVRLTASGRAKLIDFGALTHFGVQRELVGTPPFIAPECLTGVAIDQRADLYSLGALAYLCLTGHTHLPARTLEGMLDMAGAPIERPSQRVAAVPKQLDDLVMSLVQHDPRDRPATAADVIELLTTIAELPPERDAADVAASYLQHLPLVGRDNPRSALADALTHTLAGEGQIVFVHGERGVGRSALLDQFATDAQLAGATVLRADGGAQLAPFHAARALVRAGLATFPDAADGVSGPTSAPPAALRSTIEASEQHTAIASALSDQLLGLSKRTPLVLLLDDAHALDGDTLSLLAGLCEPLRRHPLLLVLTVHADADVSDNTARGRLASEARKLELLPLTEAELAELVRNIFGEVPHLSPLVHFLNARTAGNPGHTLDCVRGLLAEGAIRYAGGTFTLPHEIVTRASPSHYADAPLARLASATPLERQVAVALALHPDALGPEQVALSVAASPPDVLRALEALTRSAVVVRRGARFACDGEALRAALSASLPLADKRALHSALARALAEHDRSSLEGRLTLAGHLLQAGGQEELEGAYLLARSADQHRFRIAMMHDALPLFERALSVLKAQGHSDGQCSGLLVPLSLAGFYGSMALQRKYLDRTLLALSTMTGMMLARRLTRYLGAGLALVVGLCVGFFRHIVTRGSLNQRSFVETVQALMSVVGPATAAAASSFDPIESARIANWLDPFAAAPAKTGVYCVREFCLATAELIAGKIRSSGRRYAHVLAVFERHVPGVDDDLRDQIILGSLHGCAQGMVTDCNPEALRLADKLERRGAFYLPHAACVRMTYHAFRGESQMAAVHMDRSEALAFRGGTAWSAISVLSARAVQSHLLTGDVIALVRVVTDLERLASLAPTMAALAALARGHLALMRGQLDEALAIYDRELSTPVARSLATYPVERVQHVRALALRGDFSAARSQCLLLLEETERGGYETSLTWRLPRQELALIEAHLGNPQYAYQLLDACLVNASVHDNPLAMGSVHRDWARVALIADDRVTFAEHALEMETHFRRTGNPWLIQQCERLRAEAVRGGPAPANTNVSDGSADAPAVQTELVVETQAELIRTRISGPQRG